MPHSNQLFMHSLLSLVLGATLVTPLGCANNQTAMRTSMQRDRDAGVALAVGTKLLRDPQIDRYQVDVDAVGDVVYLRGTVRNEQQRRQAEYLAMQTEGVSRVINELEVDNQLSPAGSAFDDAWITVMVDGKLAREPAVRPENVDVDVDGGVVTLSGAVENRRAKREAERLASSVDGVNRVDNHLYVSRPDSR